MNRRQRHAAAGLARPGAASDRVLVESFAVGSRYRCTLSLPLAPERGLGFMTAEWEPAAPARLSAAELADYRIGRHALLVRAADELGVSVCVVE